MNTEKVNWLDHKAIQFEESRFGAMALMMTFQSCLGSAAAMLALKIDNYLLLGFVAVFTMGANAIFIALSPAKWCIGSFLASVIVSASVIILGIFL